MNTPIYADLDQIVFEGRSKEYGAYQMRERYNRVLTRATLIAFLLFISLTGLPKMIAWISPDEMLEFTMEDPYIIVDPVEMPTKKADPIEEEVLRVPQPPVSQARTVAFLTPNPTPEDQLKEDVLIAEVAALDTAAVGLVDHEGEEGKDYPWNEFPPVDSGAFREVTFEDPGNKEPGVKDFILLEKEPQAVNLDDLKKAIGYPPLAVEAEIQGKVLVRVLVDKYGNYVRHIVLKDPHPILTRAVSDKIDMLKMTPGIQSGKPIKVWVTLPFDFKLMN